VVVLDPGVGGVAFDRLHSLQGAALARVGLADGDQLTILRLDPEAVSVIAIRTTTNRLSTALSHLDRLVRSPGSR
jgi:hypothetical protein